MICWMRLVLPRGWILGVFGFGYLSVQVLCYRYPWDAELVSMRRQWLFLACLLFGAYRLLNFHPLFHPLYRRWLEATPWTSRLPLVVGPIHLVWQDAVVMLAAVILGCEYASGVWIEPVRLFLIGYLVSCLVALSVTSQRAIAYALAFGLGLVVRFWSEPSPFPGVAALMIELGLYGLAYLGLRRSLATFPWDPVFWETIRSASVWNQPIIGTADEMVGWPLNRLRPRPSKLYVRLSDGIFLSLLAGWWLYATSTQIQADDREDGLTISYVAILLAVIFGRFAIYLIGHAPPIGFWGRVLTLRWIIPRYDQIFLTPACALLVAVIAPTWLQKHGLSSGIAIPVSLSVVLLIAINFGPSLLKWRLTGAHRLVPALQSSVYSKL